MSIVGTSRGLLAHQQVLVLVSRRESHIPLGKGVGPIHSLLALPLEQHQAALTAAGAGVPCVASSQALGLPRVSPDGVAGVHQDFLPIFLKPVRKDLSSFRAAEERLSNSHVLRFH